MGLIADLVNQLDLHLRSWILGHMSHVTTALTASLLVIYGDDINGMVKDRVRNRHFVVRTLTFVLVCAFGFGLLAVFMAPGIARVLRYFGDRYLVLTVAAAFVGVGWLAERKKYM